MKLYYTKAACSLVPRIIINEIGLPCEYESVDLKTKKTETGKDFTSINSKGAVPTLQTDNGEIITENAVILQYLAESAHASELLPPVGDFKRYHTLEWLNYMASDMHKNLGIMFHPYLSDDAKEKVFIPMDKAKFAFIDKHLQKNKFLLGDSFTLPDAYLFVMISWAIHFKFDLKEWPNVSRFYEEVGMRPAVQKSLREEKLI